MARGWGLAAAEKDQGSQERGTGLQLGGLPSDAGSTGSTLVGNWSLRVYTCHGAAKTSKIL